MFQFTHCRYKKVNQVNAYTLDIFVTKQMSPVFYSIFFMNGAEPVLRDQKNRTVPNTVRKKLSYISVTYLVNEVTKRNNN